MQSAQLVVGPGIAFELGNIDQLANVIREAVASNSSEVARRCGLSSKFEASKHVYLEYVNEISVCARRGAVKIEGAYAVR